MVLILLPQVRLSRLLRKKRPGGSRTLNVPSIAISWKKNSPPICPLWKYVNMLGFYWRWLVRMLIYSKPMMLALDLAPMGTRRMGSRRPTNMIATSTSSNPGSLLLAPVLSRSIPIAVLLTWLRSTIITRTVVFSLVLFTVYPLYWWNRQLNCGFLLPMCIGLFFTRARLPNP